VAQAQPQKVQPQVAQKPQVVYKQVVVPVQQPVQQVVVQPTVVPIVPTTQRVITRPFTLDEKIEKTNEAVEHEAKRIYFCSWIFILFGIVCVLTGFNEIFDARRKAAFIAQEHQIPWGNANFTKFTMANVTSESMGRVEIQLFDGIRNMSILTVVVSFIIFMMGRSANRSVTKKKSKVAQRMFRRHFFLFLAFLVFYVFTRKQSRTFKEVFEHLKDGDKNTTADSSMKPANVTTMPKRNLKAMYINLDDMYKKHEVPDDLKMIMEDMRFATDEIMTNMTDDLDRMFQRHQIPQEVKDLMNNIHGYHKELKRDRHHNKKPIDFEDDEDEEEDQIDGRKMAYRMFAPGLYEQAMRKERAAMRYGRHHGPFVRADKKKNEKNAVKDWPKLHPMCPVMLFFILASIYQICRIKFLEKALAKLEFLQKAKKLVKKKMEKKGKKACPQPAPVQTFVPFAPSQPV
jgi:hypothetical protein